MTPRPKLFKKHNLWYCTYRNILGVGKTPLQAFTQYTHNLLAVDTLVTDDELL